jgi:hypothetical protein
VPLLTDAVEEIEAPSILEEPPDIEEPPEFDDPAVWTDTLTGAHSILGEDRIELPPRVPASELTSSAPRMDAAQPDDARAAQTPVRERILDTSTARSTLPDREHIADAAAARGTPVVPFDDRDFEALPRDDAADIPTVHVYDARPAGPLMPEHVPEEPTIVAATPFESTPVEASGADSADASRPETFDMGVEATLPGVAAPLAASAAPASPDAAASPALGDDEERWSALAEEIRMQVLQRIDLFTDTGLREQLAARMQPIVDRASQDLVATINQHVGVLLRAYVAEAIEREIERWRADRP